VPTRVTSVQQVCAFARSAAAAAPPAVGGGAQRRHRHHVVFTLSVVTHSGPHNRTLSCARLHLVDVAGASSAASAGDGAASVATGGGGEELKELRAVLAALQEPGSEFGGEAQEFALAQFLKARPAFPVALATTESAALRLQ
jgi:hypothetical protein